MDLYAMPTGTDVWQIRTDPSPIGGYRAADVHGVEDYDESGNEVIYTVTPEAMARLFAASGKLLAALKAGQDLNAINCSFGGQADDPDICCCGRPKAYHWKVKAREAIALAEDS